MLIVLKTGFFKLILSNYFFYFLIFLSISYLFLSQNNQLNHNISWHYDYFISFEGAYRIFIGQIPYRDFSTPVPPISFIVYGLFFKLLSPSFQTLAFIQFTINISFLAISYFILKKIIVDKYLILLSLIIFLKFYINSLNLPWYNSTAALFFITSIYFLISKSNFNILFAGIFISFTFFTKQDQGILIILFSVFLLFYENDLKQFIYKTIYILTPLLVLGFCFYFIDSDNFIKSINLFKLASAKVGGGKQLTFMLQKQFLILIFLLISMVCFKLNIKYIINNVIFGSFSTNM